MTKEKETREPHYVAYGVYGSQIYGPYTQSAVDMRQKSSVNYADTIVYPREGETIEDLYRRLTGEE